MSFLHRHISCLAITSFCLSFCSFAMAEDHAELEIWPGELPAGSVAMAPNVISKLKSELTQERIRFVDRATLTVYEAPKAIANGCAVIICPGGGYNILAWPKEGLEVAEWFNSIGVTAFVLKSLFTRRRNRRVNCNSLRLVNLKHRFLGRFYRPNGHKVNQ